MTSGYYKIIPHNNLHTSDCILLFICCEMHHHKWFHQHFFIVRFRHHCTNQIKNVTPRAFGCRLTVCYCCIASLWLMWLKHSCFRAIRPEMCVAESARITHHTLSDSYSTSPSSFALCAAAPSWTKTAGVLRAAPTQSAHPRPPRFTCHCTCTVKTESWSL